MGNTKMNSEAMTLNSNPIWMSPLPEDNQTAEIIETPSSCEKL